MLRDAGNALRGEALKCIEGTSWTAPELAVKVSEKAHWNPVLFRDADGNLLERVTWEPHPFLYSAYDVIDVSVPSGVASIELVLNPMDDGFPVHLREVAFKGKALGDRRVP